MYIIAQTAQPYLLKDRLPFSNSTPIDKEVYQSSIYLLDVKGKLNEYFLDVDDVQVIGVLPFVNVKISAKSEHSVLVGKTFKPGVYVGLKSYYRPSSTSSLWWHDCLFLFNSSLMGEIEYSGNFCKHKSKKLRSLISAGTARGLDMDVVNPIHKSKHLYGVNIHRGPGAKNTGWNYSLGCVTVEPSSFDLFMKQIPSDSGMLYLHRFDEHGPDCDKVFRMNYTSCQGIMSSIHSYNNRMEVIK